MAADVKVVEEVEVSAARAARTIRAFLCSNSFERRASIDLSSERRAGLERRTPSVEAGVR